MEAVKKKKTNGKAKGSGGERLVCRILSKWINGTEKPYVFYRSANSGGLATVLGMYEDMSGDIMCIRPEGKDVADKFSIEIKTGYKDACLDKCLKDNKNEDFRDFWTQCNRDATNAKKLPLLIYNRNGAQPKNMWIGFCNNGIEMLSKLNDLVCVSIKFDKKYELPNLNLFNFQEFLDIISIEDFHATN